jgi:hypothetical protein
VPIAPVISRSLTSAPDSPTRLAWKSLTAVATPCPWNFSFLEARGSMEAAMSSVRAVTAAKTAAHTCSAPDSSPLAQRQAVSPSTAQVRPPSDSSASSNQPVVRA